MSRPYQFAPGPTWRRIVRPVQGPSSDEMDAELDEQIDQSEYQLEKLQRYRELYGGTVKRKMETNPAEVRLRTRRLWTDPSGRYAVVYAVYPQGLVRSLTRKTVDSCKTVPLAEVSARNSTTQAAHALVPTRYLLDEENDWGEVAP